MPLSLKNISWVIDFLLPRTCPLCHEPRSYGKKGIICLSCQDSLERSSPPWCSKCGKPFRSEVTLSHSPDHVCEECQKSPPEFDSARSIGPYDGLFRELIHLMKYKGYTSVAVELGAMLSGLARREIRESLAPENILITFVPIDHERWKIRGFDQAKVLARSTGKYLGLPFAATIVRKKSTPPQSSLSATKRKKIFRGVFLAKSLGLVYGKRVILIDDVLTTGSTASACARELKKAGAASVDVLTVCHTLLQIHSLKL